MTKLASMSNEQLMGELSLNGQAKNTPFQLELRAELLRRLGAAVSASPQPRTPRDFLRASGQFGEYDTNGSYVLRGFELESLLAQFFAAAPAQPVECKGRKTTGDNNPGDCDWPFCDCDPKANKVMQAIQESGYTLTKAAPAQEPQWERVEGVDVRWDEAAKVFVGKKIILSQGTTQARAVLAVKHALITLGRLISEREAGPIAAQEQPVENSPRLDDSRCAVCGWPLAESVEKGCTRGNCSMRPFPDNIYDPARANKEYKTERFTSGPQKGKP